MDNLQQVEAIKKALNGEVYIANTSRELSKLLSEKFQQAPLAPAHNIIQRTYPEIVPKGKF